MKFRFRFLLFLCLFPTVSFAQIEIGDGTRPMVVDDSSNEGDGLGAVVHIGTKFPAGPKDKTFTILCQKQFDSGNDNPGCVRLFPGTGYTIRRIPKSDPRAYAEGQSVEVTYPVNMGGGFAGQKVIYWIMF
jgi:hypothetical protein